VVRRRYLPPVCLIQPSLAAMAATYRQITAARLHTPTGEVHHTHLFSPVLSALPHIFDDEDIYRAFVTLWLQQPKTTAFERVRAPAPASDIPGLPVVISGLTSRIRFHRSDFFLLSPSFDRQRRIADPRRVRGRGAAATRWGWRRRWRDWTRAPQKDTLLRFEALHSCVLRMWPMTMLENLPPGSLSSDQEHTAKRIGVIKDYLKQHPVQPLSKAPAWHNEPFDSSELAYRFVDHIL